MDLGIVAALVMLAVWAFATFTTTAPGWIHLLLSVGVFLLIYRIVIIGTARSIGKGKADGKAKKTTS